MDVSKGFSKDADYKFANPRFTRRGTFKIGSTADSREGSFALESTESDNWQPFQMDGREDIPVHIIKMKNEQSFTKTLSQETSETLCVTCHGAQEFSKKPLIWPLKLMLYFNFS